MGNPFAEMSAAEMEKLRLQNPEKFEELCQQLDVPDMNAKTVVYRNGLVVAGAPPAKE